MKVSNEVSEDKIRIKALLAELDRLEAKVEALESGKPIRYKYQYLLRMPMTAAVLLTEGGEWINFKDFQAAPGSGNKVHGVTFVGGHIWDCVNGWRNTTISSTAGRGLTCREAPELRDAPKSYERIESDIAYPEHNIYDLT